MVEGVTDGFKKELERAAASATVSPKQGKDLVMNLGYLAIRLR